VRASLPTFVHACPATAVAVAAADAVATGTEATTAVAVAAATLVCGFEGCCSVGVFTIAGSQRAQHAWDLHSQILGQLCVCYMCLL
jgi:hypothetical protein